MEKDIYMEYSNGDFEYLSFTKVKNLIFKELPNVLKFNCEDKEKSINFLNTLLSKYKIVDNSMILKQSTHFRTIKLNTN